MKKIQYLTMILLLFVFCNNDVNAICRKNTIESIKNEANKIEVSYEYNDEYFVDGNKVNGTYKVEIKNMLSNMYAQIDGYETKYNYEEDNHIIIEGVESGIQNLIIYYKPCNEMIKTIKLNMPKYNKYSDREECIGIMGEELDVCDKWYPYELNESTFLYKLKEYNKKQELQEENPKNETQVIKNISSFWEKYSIYIILGIVAIVSIIIVIIVKRKKYSLE